MSRKLKELGWVGLIPLAILLLAACGGNVNEVKETLTEWNLPSESWTFIIDSDGLISSKFEAFTTATS